MLREFEAVLEGERKVLEDAQGERREVWHHSRRRMGGKMPADTLSIRFDHAHLSACKRLDSTLIVHI